MKRLYFYIIFIILLLGIGSSNYLIKALNNNEILDIKYNDKSDKQKLDIYYPDNREKKSPVVIFLHGGSYSGGDKSKGIQTNKNFFNKNGFVLVSVNYRLSGEKTFPTAVDDAKTALRFLKKNAQEYGLDKNNFYLAGFSAGANLGSMILSTEGIEALGDEEILYNQENSNIAGFMGFSGFYELNSYFIDKKATNSHSANENILKYYNSDYYDEKTPFVFENNTNYLKNVKKPVLLIHGADDGLVKPIQSKLYYDLLKMRTNNKDVEFYKFEGIKHEFVEVLNSKKSVKIIEWLNNNIKNK